MMNRDDHNIRNIFNKDEVDLACIRNQENGLTYEDLFQIYIFCESR